MKARISVSMAAAAVVALALSATHAAPALRAQAVEAGFTSLFNGKDLTGWTVAAVVGAGNTGEGIFAVVDGAIQANGVPGAAQPCPPRRRPSAGCSRQCRRRISLRAFVGRVDRAHLAPPHLTIASRATAARPFKRGSLPPVARELIVRLSAERLARRPDHEGLKWVELTTCPLPQGTAVLGAQPPLAWVLAKDGFPGFADLHHHDLRPSEPSAPSRGSAETRVSPGTSRTLPKRWPPSLPSPPIQMALKARHMFNVMRRYQARGHTSALARGWSPRLCLAAHLAMQTSRFAPP